MARKKARKKIAKRRSTKRSTVKALSARSMKRTGMKTRKSRKSRSSRSKSLSAAMAGGWGAIYPPGTIFKLQDAPDSTGTRKPEEQPLPTPRDPYGRGDPYLGMHYPPPPVFTSGGGYQ